MHSRVIIGLVVLYPYYSAFPQACLFKMANAFMNNDILSTNSLFPQARWFKFNYTSSDYIELMSDEKYSVYPNGSLSIIDVQKEDEGTYRVMLSNNAGIVSEDIEVEVIEPMRKLIDCSNKSVQIMFNLESVSVDLCFQLVFSKPLSFLISVINNKHRQLGKISSMKI